MPKVFALALGCGNPSYSQRRLGKIAVATIGRGPMEEFGSSPGRDGSRQEHLTVYGAPEGLMPVHAAGQSDPSLVRSDCGQGRGPLSAARIKGLCRGPGSVPLSRSVFAGAFRV